MPESTIRRRFEYEARAPWTTTLTKEDWPLLVGLPAIAGLFVFAGSRLGWWAFIVATLVYAVGYRAFDLHRRADRAYDDLVATLEILPEISGHLPEGHGRRIAATANRLALDLGLDERSHAEVVVAARCREVGRIALDDEEDDDATTARWSGAIVECAEPLSAVADLVGPLDPCLDPHRRSLRAIVDVVVAYEEATAVRGLGPGDAVAMLRSAAGRDAIPALDVLEGRPEAHHR